MPRPDWVDDLGVNDADMDGEYMRIGSQIASAGMALALSMRSAARAKAHRKRVWAQEFEDTLDSFRAAGARITDKSVDSAVRRSEGYIRAQNEEIDADYGVELAKARCKAFAAKKDALVSLGANMRAEMGAG